MMLILCAQFHLENAKARSLHRIKEGRAKPIDFLVRDLLLGDSLEIGLAAPYEAFRNLKLSDVQTLKEDLLEFQVWCSACI